jgi:uncharacterized membrane protein (UPF0127 family)
MRIENLTRHSLIVSDAREARSFSDKLFGLMGKATLPPQCALIIYDTNWIHTFWMRFALDLIYIDKQQRVVGLTTALPPNRIDKPFWSAKHVIELNAGLIQASQTQLGDQLKFS